MERMIQDISLIKPLAFWALSFHWFNPLVWVGFMLMSRDMEMSCDENVVGELGDHIKKDYTKSLLSISAGRRLTFASPLAFGESGAKARIRNVLRYKKPSFWVIAACIVIMAVIAIGLISDPVKADKEAVSSSAEVTGGNAAQAAQAAQVQTTVPDSSKDGQAPAGTADTGSSAPEKISPAAEEIPIGDLTEKTIITPDRFESTKYPLVAELPKDHIYLYGQPNGVVLKYGEKIQAFSWNYLTPGFILPILQKYDLDKDGADEIICWMYIGSGAGVSVDDLHVLKLDSAGKYIDYFYRDYLGQVGSLLSCEYNKEEGKLLLRTGNKSWTYAFPEEYLKLTYKDLSYGNIVRFDVSDGIRMDMPLSIIFEGNPVPQPAGDASFEGEIIFRDGKFLIQNPRIINLE